MNRDILINFIPKPTNSDVILYDISLKDLIDVDVFQEYQKLLPVYNLAKQQFLGYKGNIESYEKMINNIYLYKNDWGEEDYLYYLQNEKKTYANLFGPIKRIESNIETLQKKIKQIEEKIELQTAKETRELESKKNNIDKRIDENASKIIALKDVISTLKLEKSKIAENIYENQTEFEILQKMVEEAQNGKCKCEYCGSTITNVSQNSRFYTRMYKKIDENKTLLESLLVKKEKNDEELKIYETNMKQLKQEMQNDINFKSEELNFYQKKSLEILKLEGQRDSMLNNISELERQLRIDSQTRSKQFLDLKDKISKYELSLENLKKIKEIKSKISENKQEYTKLYDELTEMNKKMKQFKNFLTIFFKIYEQKAAEFCGKGFKFKIFEFEDFVLKEIFKIYYNDIEYINLSPQYKKLVDDTLEEKFLFYN